MTQKQEGTQLKVAADQGYRKLSSANTNVKSFAMESTGGGGLREGLPSAGSCKCPALQGARLDWANPPKTLEKRELEEPSLPGS